MRKITPAVHYCFHLAVFILSEKSDKKDTTKSKPQSLHYFRSRLMVPWLNLQTLKDAIAYNTR